MLSQPIASAVLTITQKVSFKTSSRFFLLDEDSSHIYIRTGRGVYARPEARMGDRFEIRSPVSANETLGSPAAKHTADRDQDHRALCGLGVFLIVFLHAAINFLTGFFAGVAIFFLQRADELIALARDAIEVAVGEFAPPLFRAPAHLFPLALQNVVVHG